MRIKPLFQFPVGGLLLLACWGLTAAAGSANTPDEVRRDWYFRESLAAIRDWEDLLIRWEQQTPEAARTPVLPVPATDEAITWPNPIPALLLPPEAMARTVTVRANPDGQMRVERTEPKAAAVQNEVAGGDEVLGCQHPGGGGKDQWYHAYHRRFDRLTRFRPKLARFALQWTAPLALHRGGNVLVIEVRSAADQPLQLQLGGEFRTPDRTRGLGQHILELAPGSTITCRLPLRLDAPGGGLVCVTIRDGEDTYWFPLLTHVERVADVLASLRQILADMPAGKGAVSTGPEVLFARDTNGTSTGSPEKNSRPRSAAEELDALQRLADQWPGADAGPSWSELFERASRLRDQWLLNRVPFDTLLFVKRKPFISEQPFMDAHHLFNRPGGGVYRLSPVRPDGRVTPVIDSLGEGVYRDLCLHWDARRLLFAWGNGSDDWDGSLSYHVYEANVDGSGLRQLTTGPKNDCEPFYLPNGQIGFTSDRSEHFVMCGGDRHAPNLFVTDAAGSEVRRLSFNVFNDFTPAVLPDGRILYGRWEYNERSVTSLHNPFTMHPDGRMVSPYYGNATIRPNVVMFARPVPDSHLVMALFTAHHGQTHGAVGLIDVRRGIDGLKPLTVLTPHVPITGEKAEDSRHGWFSDPLPLDEQTWLCSYTPTVLPWLETTWALYVADQHGNLGLVYRDPGISCAEPLPLVTRRRPHVLPPAPPGTDARNAEAEVVLADAYQGLSGVSRGAAKYLRILEDVPREGVHRGGVVCTSGTLIFTVKRVLGTVPIEADGSAYFAVPANRNVYFAVLDTDRLEIQRMRSVVCLKPGEQRSCIGCHEPPNLAPPTPAERGSSGLAALRRAPSRPQPPPWGTQIISYLRDVQPMLDARCVRCHAFDRPGAGVILTGDLTDQFCVSYEELLPYLSVAISNRWDHPDDVVGRPPYTYGSQVSELTRLLRAGHHDVQLTGEDWDRLTTWIDANGVYYDRYESEHFAQRRIFADPARQELAKVFQRRCAECHGSDDGRHDTWWLSLNRHDVRLSRSLAAPLSAAAGGWGRCRRTVFASADDPDYQTLRSVLTSLRTTLDEHPREDLLSLRGTDAERQVVELPPPPLAAGTEALPGGWVDLLALPWEAAQSGWTPNDDGQPRRNRDVTNQPLHLGSRRYATGIGTHAPSEIRYQLDGRYARFTCLVGAAERGGSVVFQVYGDERKLFDSGTLLGLSDARRVDLAISGVQQLRLVVTDAGDGYIRDMANWANPQLLWAEHGRLDGEPRK
jgi:hypothetical protein